MVAHFNRFTCAHFLRHHFFSPLQPQLAANPAMDPATRARIDADPAAYTREMVAWCVQCDGGNCGDYTHLNEPGRPDLVSCTNCGNCFETFLWTEAWQSKHDAEQAAKKKQKKAAKKAKKAARGKAGKTGAGASRETNETRRKTENEKEFDAFRRLVAESDPAEFEPCGVEDTEAFFAELRAKRAMKQNA